MVRTKPVEDVLAPDGGPGRRRLLGTLAICTVLYVGVSLVITDMVPYSKLDEGALIDSAFDAVGLLVHLFYGRRNARLATRGEPGATSVEPAREEGARRSG